jgi:hypothetical protein
MDIRRYEMKKVRQVQISCPDGQNLFVEADGVRIAHRGRPGTPQAGTWVSIEPGWEVIDASDGGSILIKQGDVTVH